MILFKEYHIKLILDGTKTQTRRVWKDQRMKVGSIHQIKTSFFNTDFFAKILITGVRKERLGDITEEDARKEGGYSVEQYKKVWETINGLWQDDLKVYVIDFRRV